MRNLSRTLLSSFTLGDTITPIQEVQNQNKNALRMRMNQLKQDVLRIDQEIDDRMNALEMFMQTFDEEQYNETVKTLRGSIRYATKTYMKAMKDVEELTLAIERELNEKRKRQLEKNLEEAKNEESLYKKRRDRDMQALEMLENRKKTLEANVVNAVSEKQSLQGQIAHIARQL